VDLPTRPGSLLVLTHLVRPGGAVHRVGIAHELGHYLGLGHESDQNNMMHGPTTILGKCNCGPQMVELTSAQADTMNSHCMALQT
jgi:hypothetical protein